MVPIRVLRSNTFQIFAGNVSIHVQREYVKNAPNAGYNLTASAQLCSNRKPVMHVSNRLSGMKGNGMNLEMEFLSWVLLR